MRGMSEPRPLTALVPALRRILNAELAAGNAIAEVADWPPHCELFVLLRRPFQCSHVPRPGVVFTAVDDRHYWKSEFSVDGGRQTLACGFG